MNVPRILIGTLLIGGALYQVQIDPSDCGWYAIILFAVFYILESYYEAI